MQTYLHCMFTCSCIWKPVTKIGRRYPMCIILKRNLAHCTQRQEWGIPVQLQNVISLGIFIYIYMVKYYLPKTVIGYLKSNLISLFDKRNCDCYNTFLYFTYLILSLNVEGAAGQCNVCRSRCWIEIPSDSFRWRYTGCITTAHSANRCIVLLFLDKA